MALEMGMPPELRAARVIDAQVVISVVPTGKAIQNNKGLDFRLSHCKKEMAPPSGLSYFCNL